MLMPAPTRSADYVRFVCDACPAGNLLLCVLHQDEAAHYTVTHLDCIAVAPGKRGSDDNAMQLDGAGLSPPSPTALASTLDHYVIMQLLPYQHLVQLLLLSAPTYTLVNAVSFASNDQLVMVC